MIRRLALGIPLWVPSYRIEHVRVGAQIQLGVFLFNRLIWRLPR